MEVPGVQGSAGIYPERKICAEIPLELALFKLLDGTSLCSALEEV